MKVVRFKRLVIYGVGLLGGSLGMAVRARGLAGEAVGLGRNAARLEEARELGAVDSFSTDSAEALKGADGLVLALPPRLIREAMTELAPHVEPGIFVTDVGSVKEEIVAAGETLLPAGTLFAGAHPMAGSEKTGAVNGNADFFEGAACLVTPTPVTDSRALEMATDFWSALGSRVIEIDPASHDRLLAGVSHLPHIAAAALMQALARQDVPIETIAKTAGNGLRDTTRIAGADPWMWAQIAAGNARALTGQLDLYIDILRSWREELSATEPGEEKLAEMFEQGRDCRRKLDPREG